jgi:hypothetical protein
MAPGGSCRRCRQCLHAAPTQQQPVAPAERWAAAEDVTATGIDALEDAQPTFDHQSQLESDAAGKFTREWCAEPQ